MNYYGHNRKSQKFYHYRSCKKIKMSKDNENMQEIADGENKNEKVSAKEFAAKYQSKRETYNFLACDVGAYLPPYDNVTIYFLKELMSGKKKMLHSANHRTIHIPQ